MFNLSSIPPNVPYLFIKVWATLGFYRGMNVGIHKFITNGTDTGLYINTLSYGVFGFVVYANPLLLPLTIYKELYRLEVNLRNLKHEKDSKFYNSIL
jgi:hypothetical protein